MFKRAHKSEYTVFVGDKPIVLTTDFTEDKESKTFLLKSAKMGKVIKLLNKTDLQEVRLVDENADKLLKRFFKKLPKVIAGGGKVYNKNGEVLFIYRNNKWDLPKGKTEKKESIEATAIREVEEETGVKDLKIVKPLPTTYHIFKRNGRYKLKVTYWFEMVTDYIGAVQPEENEGITKVKWLDAQSSKEALQNSYANIKLLF